jgi:thioredoxin-like negative regulator of GroEL
MAQVLGFAIVGAALMAAAPAAAQERAVRSSHAAIAQGDLAKAERVLTAERRIHPAKPEVLLNLAAVYAHSGRASDASALYRQVLAQQDVLMDLSADRTTGSHAIARAGLGKLQPAIATR